MKLLQVLIASVLVAGLGVAAGCKGDSTGGQAPLIVAASSPIADVPVPAGFMLDAGKSWSNWNPNLKLRSVNHEYKGKDGMLAVVRFYKEQLPAFKWSDPVLDQQGKKVTLKSGKTNEDLVITVSEGILDTHINIKLDPAGNRPGK